ncbi:serine/threonine protein kinase [Planotetraspora sp. A-T 1434]|uniref:serine/threonine-protein kinase n=1 Tax=Planotetraspora sp. A-T 1434 TaxID=2979219 RepID=UPI0021C07111|nr:serine/threonine-protein kinase [Planotetraspora sp. A-T 1434]MCT9931360.1 serine/threonine protein kinase [Planotetraspora sp. A-T 1434]
MGPSEHVPPRATLGPYRLLSPLGSGGFGEVHLALDPEGHTVAVKVLLPHVASDAFALTRLAREVETMRRVRGPHIAEVLDASLTGPRPYIVTRYVQGRALSTVIASEGPVRDDDLVRLVRGLAEALECIHGAGVVHRDLKPANVIIADREPYVIDFGIACALESASVTASGAVVGTPGYLAPEVLEGHDAGPESDVFALAATLAFAASGRQPYGTGPAAAIAYRVVHREPDLSGVPSWLGPLLAECLRTDPAARPTAPQFAARLGVVAPPPSERRAEERPRERAKPIDLPLYADHFEPAGWGNPAHYAGSVPPAGPHPLDRPPLDRPRDAEPTVTGTVGEPRTREWRPGDRKRSIEAIRARHRAKLHRRWVLGSSVVVGLFAAAARRYLPEVSLLLLALYGTVVVIDVGLGLLAKSRSRVIVDAMGGVGVVAVWALLSTLFSTTTLLFAVGTVLFLLIALVFAS